MNDVIQVTGDVVREPGNVVRTNGDVIQHPNDGTQQLRTSEMACLKSRCSHHLHAVSHLHAPVARKRCIGEEM